MLENSNKIPSENSKDLHNVQLDNQEPEKDSLQEHQKRPLTDADEAVKRENQPSSNDSDDRGSAKEGADFENPEDDPA